MPRRFRFMLLVMALAFLILVLGIEYAKRHPMSEDEARTGIMHSITQ